MISGSAQAGGVVSVKLRSMESDLAESGSGKLHTFFTVTRKNRVWKTIGKDIALQDLSLGTDSWCLERGFIGAVYVECLSSQ